MSGSRFNRKPRYSGYVTPDKVIGPALLFQRFLVVSQIKHYIILSLEDVMGYELSPFPPALFEAINVFRKPDKPQRAISHAITDHLSSSTSEDITKSTNIPRTEHYVLDGCSFILTLEEGRQLSYNSRIICGFHHSALWSGRCSL